MTVTQLSVPAGRQEQPSTAALRVAVIDDAAGFAALRSEWRELLASSRADCLFLTWEWLHTWWTHLGQRRRLFIVTVRCGSKLIALAPLTMHRAIAPLPMCALEFVGTGSVGSDYLDFIVDATYESVTVEALTAFFAAEGFSLRLPSVREDSIVASAFKEQLCARGWRWRNIAMQVSPFIDLSQHSWESYVGSLGASHRYNFRRRLRNLEKSYAVRFERPDSEGECRMALSHVVNLHLRRWNARGGSDAFHTDSLLAFHRDFSEVARQEGWLRLRVLTLDGQPAGAFYGFRYGDKYSFYQSAFDESFLRQSIGLVTIGLTIKEAIEEGAAEYDMLHGDESYKFLWASEVRPLFRTELYSPGMIGRMHRDSVIAFAATKKMVKRALRREDTCSTPS
jgi:CelD/BcsL family acetyltransferase involved in cellulose biosynthesis